MVKSGLIIGAGTFLLTLISGLVQFQICAPCLALFLGLGAGYLAGLFDKKPTSGEAAQSGAAAGAIGGAGAILGHAIGGTAGFFLFGQQQAAELMEQLGLPSSSSSGAGQVIGAIGGSLCFGVVDLLLMAGLGALGGMVWYQISGKPKTPPDAPVLPPINE
jgi:hypothetical protein